MTRVLYWNISNFSLNKIADPDEPLSSQDRRNHIVDEVLRGFAANPDIFVVVEVFGRLGDVGYEGVPLSGNAATAVIALLARIQAQTGDPWRLVPPLWSGQTYDGEGVAVFYNSNSLRFTGPYVFGADYRTAGRLASGAWFSRPVSRSCTLANTQPAGGTPPLPAGWPQGAQNYPLLWAGCLSNRVTGGGMPAEDQLAGQVEFYAALGGRLQFPGARNRSPYLTTFRDLTFAGGGRTIKLFAMHTKPGFGAAAVGQLQHVQELAAGANEVTVLVGDFNVDSFDNRAAYNGLVGAVGGGGVHLGMTMAFRPETGGAIAADRRPYCTTHLLPTARATPYGVAGGVAAGPTHDVYPRFGYMGSMGAPGFNTPVTSGAIDNIFTLYGLGAAGAPANATVVNTIVGQPYTGVPALARPAAVTADLTSGTACVSRIPAGAAIPIPAGEDSTVAGADVTEAVFETWPNFGRIHSTSDHLALMIDV